jgi:hypothetical protein
VADHFPIRSPTSTLTYTSMTGRLMSQNKQVAVLYTKRLFNIGFICSRNNSNLLIYLCHLLLFPTVIKNVQRGVVRDNRRRATRSHQLSTILDSRRLLKSSRRHNSSSLCSHYISGISRCSRDTHCTQKRCAEYHQHFPGSIAVTSSQSFFIPTSTRCTSSKPA